MTKRISSKRKATKADRSTPGASRRSLIWRFRRFFFFAGVLVIATATGALWAASQVQLPTTNPVLDQTSFVCTAEVTHDCNEKNAIASLHGDVNRVVVPLSQISPEMQNAILAAEDKDFFKHGGVDPVGIARAAWIDIQGGSGTHGGSTLTQQYVKLTYLSSQRTFKRKIKEAVLSIKLEQQMSKKQIFENYLNLVYFGRGAYGVQAAAQSYFNIDAKDLNLQQAAFLAGIVRNPSWASDATISRNLRKVVLGNMVKNKMIDDAQYKAADASPLGIDKFVASPGVNWLGGSLGTQGADPYAARYFVQAVIKSLEKSLTSHAVFNDGLRIYTTLQPERQRQAYEAVTGTLNFGDHPSGALVAVDNSGKVVAMVGGTDYTKDKVNLATGAAGGGGGRQPGSTFKAFALAELVKQGYSIGSSVPANYKTVFKSSDYPILPEDWTVFSDCCGGGASSVVDATAQSINSSYAQIMLDLGPEKVDQMARDLGVKTNFQLRPQDKSKPNGKKVIQSYASDVLGSVDVSVLDIANAYSTFARGGIELDPQLVTRVEDRDGNVVASYKPQRNMVLSQTKNARVVYALQQVVQRGTGTGANIGRPAAGKTGTVAKDSQTMSNDGGSISNSDAWFTGFVPGFTASVWMGYEDSRGMSPQFQGASYPAEIWKKFMTAALADVKPTDFPKVDDLMGGKFLTSWGGSRYAADAPTVDYYNNGGGSSSSGDGGNTGGGGGGNGGGSGDTTPATTLAPSVSTPGSTSPPETSPPTTGAPPPTPPPTTPPAPPGGGKAP